MEKSGDNMHMVDTQRLERQIGKLEERVASFGASMDKLMEMLPDLKETLRWVAQEKTLGESRKERWQQIEQRLTMLEKRNSELEMEAVRQQEKEASRRWISSFATSILTAIAVALVLPLFTKGR